MPKRHELTRGYLDTNLESVWGPLAPWPLHVFSVCIPRQQGYCQFAVDRQALNWNFTTPEVLKPWRPSPRVVPNDFTCKAIPFARGFFIWF